MPDPTMTDRMLYGAGKHRIQLSEHELFTLLALCGDVDKLDIPTDPAARTRFHEAAFRITVKLEAAMTATPFHQKWRLMNGRRQTNAKERFTTT